MTDTLISLISIFIGITGANLTGYFFKRYSFGITGNTIAGVFGSVFFIKTFGRLGFDPTSIMQGGHVHPTLFTINSIVSYFGGSLALVLIFLLQTKMNSNKNQ